MECMACKREKFRKENPKAVVKADAISHTCNQPERSKREDTVIFKKFPNFEPPKATKELLEAWGYDENGDAVL